MNRHELHAYDYVNHPYETVRDALLANPLSVFRHATATTEQRNEAGLHAKAGPLEVGAEVDIDVLGIKADRAPNGRVATQLSIAWKAKRRPALFPTMRATISVYALTPTETQLELDGVYDPPLGVLGSAIDAVAMHRIAEESVTGFIQDVATFLRGLLSAPGQRQNQLA